MITTEKQASMLYSLCQGDAYNVVWAGNITLKNTIMVGVGTNLTIKAAISLHSSESAVIDGGGSVQLFNVAGGILSLNGLSNGYSYNDFGGAVNISAYSLTGVTSEVSIDHCSFRSCSAVRGGAVYAGEESLLTISNSEFKQNVAYDDTPSNLLAVAGNGGGSYGGALALSGIRQFLNITNTTFTGNSAIHGAAVYTEELLLIIQSSIYTFTTVYLVITSVLKVLTTVRLS
jgi:predicted outer membrane repeat protein